MIKKITNFIFEALHLKNIDHVGFKRIGIEDPDSVAEHSLNAAQIGYILAKLEGVDAQKVSSMLIWHDIAETRIGDLDKVAIRYIKNKNELETNVLEEQLAGLEWGEEIKAYFVEFEAKETLEAKCARDADYLEQAFQAKIYLENGHKDAQNWITNVGNALRTKSAKNIWNEMIDTSFTDWRKDLQNLKNV